MSSQKHAIVGLSGGVDSAVAAYLLKEQGYRVSALFMQNWAEDESGYCTAAQDYQDARAVAEELAIPLHRVDFSAQYRERVFAAFIRQLKEGKTPNPDVLCNREIKFQPFVEHARRLGAEVIATGHYAQIAHGSEGPQLLRAVDENKDQTYFLAGVAREHFADVAFPIGGLNKPQVRELAAKAGLPNHRKKDSTGICFIGERPFADFLAEHLPKQPGIIEGDDGKPLGEHPGLQFFTLGQRKGVRIGGVKGGLETPWYVVGKDKARNVLVVSQNAAHPGLMHQKIATGAFHWLQQPEGLGKRELSVMARLRHRQPLVACQVQEDGAGRVTASFEVPQRAATPGQYLALYQGPQCLGCGEIAAPEQAISQ